MITIDLTVQELPHVLVDQLGAVLLHPVTALGNVPAATHEAKLELLSCMQHDLNMTFIRTRMPYQLHGHTPDHNRSAHTGVVVRQLCHQESIIVSLKCCKHKNGIKFYVHPLL